MDKTLLQSVAAGSEIILIMQLMVSILMIISMWKIFVKAGQPGWAILIPFYNIFVMLKVAGKPGWWFLLLFLPIINIVISIIILIGISENFGKSGGFAVGLLFLPFIFYPILAFSDAEYQQ